jgi:hypothetical protein
MLLRVASATRTSNEVGEKTQLLNGTSTFAVVCPDVASNTTAHSSPTARSGCPAGAKIVYRSQNASGWSGSLARR